MCFGGGGVQVTKGNPAPYKPEDAYTQVKTEQSADTSPKTPEAVQPFNNQQPAPVLNMAGLNTRM